MSIHSFLKKLTDEYKDFHIILVWDNAPFHRKKELHEIKNLTPIFLPPYSQQLNPVEQFYGEIRKATANRIFKDIETQQNIIDIEIAKWMNDKDRTKKLCAYEWILEQWKIFSF